MVPLPQILLPKLKTQLEFVSKLHEKDIVAGYAGVYLVDAMERKYPTAAKDFIWQWFFPHLLQANYDIRTIQMMFGHTDVRTTMISTHCMPSLTVKDAKSPLDF